MTLLDYFLLKLSFCDAAEPWQLGSQDGATPMIIYLPYVKIESFSFWFYVSLKPLFSYFILWRWKFYFISNTSFLKMEWNDYRAFWDHIYSFVSFCY